MENKSGRKNVAFCVGDLEGSKMLLQGFCNVLGDNRINVHIFNCCTCFYDGAPHNIGQTNIFNLPNYDIIDMLIIAPFYLSTKQQRRSDTAYYRTCGREKRACTHYRKTV